MEDAATLDSSSRQAPPTPTRINKNVESSNSPTSTTELGSPSHSQGRVYQNPAHLLSVSCSLISDFDSVYIEQSTADKRTFADGIIAEIECDNFSNPKRIIDSTANTIHALAFTHFRDESSDFKRTVTNSLSLCSKKYETHIYPEMSSVSQTLSTSEQDQLQLNWKKWSSYKYIAAKFNDIDARTDLLNALTEKTELHEEAQLLDHSEVRTEMLSFYEIQIMFVRNLMLETRYTFMGEIVPTNIRFLYKPSEC